MLGGDFLEPLEVEASECHGNCQIQIHQTGQKDDAAHCEKDGHFPSHVLPFAAAPIADEQESRDERQFVKGVHEKCVLREKRTGRASADEEHGTVK